MFLVKISFFYEIRDYRVRKLLTEKGSYVFEMKEKDNELKN
jgi:N-hydroxyarylamine O-acetyltransferase